MKTCFAVTSDEQKIAYDHYVNGHDKLVIVAPGFLVSKKAILFRDLAKALLPDFDIVVLDFRGHGESSGFFTWTSREYLDLIAVVNAVCPRYQRTGVIGFSLGAATSIIAASQTASIHSLVAVSAPVSFWKIDYHFWKLDIEGDVVYNWLREGRIGKGVRPGPFWHKRIRPLDAIGKVRCPCLFFYGGLDWVVKPWHAAALFEKAQGQKRKVFFENGPHAEHLLRVNKNRTEMLDSLRSWFKETLS